jgi:hypothetical protein
LTSQVFVEAFVKACRAKDARAVASLLATAWEKEAKTCRIISGPPHEDVFTQVNEKTWTKTVDGMCGTSVMTLWRHEADDSFWNYSQVRSVMPNAPTDSLLGCDKISTRTDWVFWDRPSMPVACTFFE